MYRVHLLVDRHENATHMFLKYAIDYLWATDTNKLRHISNNAFTAKFKPNPKLIDAAISMDSSKIATLNENAYYFDNKYTTSFL